jgi:hypothetical protein
MNMFNADAKKIWYPTGDTIPSFYQYMTNSGEFYECIISGRDSTKKAIPLNKSVREYYKYEVISDCVLQSAEVDMQCESYVTTIKGEIYRLLMIPVVVFILYNFYYLFFFKDVFGYAKSYDEDTGDPIYNSTPDDKDRCFYPIFPNWENEFHKLEEHHTDFFLEFVFKPLNIIVALLNWSKDFIRLTLKTVVGWIGGNTFDNNSISHLLFMASFVLVYIIVDKFWLTLYGIARDLMSLKVPSSTISAGDSNETFYSISIVVTWVCFARSLMIGIYNYFFPKQDPADIGKIKFPDSILLRMLKFLFFILYWCLKGVVTNYFIPFSVMISFVYIVWMGLCGILNYTDNEHSYGDKIELMQRVIYTKVCSLNENYDYIFKPVCFLLVFFMIEIVIVYTICTSMTVFNNMEMPIDPNMPDDAKEKGEQVLDDIKTLLFITCIFFNILIGIWGGYRLFSQGRNIYDYYKIGGSRSLETGNCPTVIPQQDENEVNEKNETKFKEFYEKHEKYISEYNEIIENKSWNIITHVYNSGRNTDLFIDYYTAKTGHITPRPVIKRMLNTWNGYVKKTEGFVNRFSGYKVESTDKKPTMYEKISKYLPEMPKIPNMGIKSGVNATTNTTNDFISNHITRPYKEPTTAQLISENLKGVGKTSRIDALFSQNQK